MDIGPFFSFFKENALLTLNTLQFRRFKSGYIYQECQIYQNLLLAHLTKFPVFRYAYHFLFSQSQIALSEVWNEY